MKINWKKTGLSAVVVLLTVLLLLAITPFLFQNKIVELVKKEINKQLVSDVDFDKAKLSLIRNFPNASIHIDNLLVIGRDDFANDTLLNSRKSILVIDLKSLFGNSAYDVKNLLIQDASIFAHELEDGRVNWDIFKPDSLVNEESSFHFKLKDARFLQVDVSYLSEKDQMAAHLLKSNLIVNGDFAAKNTLLKTSFSTEKLNFWNESLRLVHDWKMSFEADVKANFNEDFYELADNKMYINAIPLSLNAGVKLLDEGFDVDLELNTDDVDFKSLLSLVPLVYSDSFKDLNADGHIDFSGKVKGIYSDEMFPAFDFNLKVSDGKIQYAGLPKSVDQIQINSKISNEGGDLDNTLVDLSMFSFRIDNNPFEGALLLKNIVSDPNFAFKAKGVLNLNTIKDLFPLEEGMKLAGLINMDVGASGKMSFIENNAYDKFRFEGDVQVSQFNFELNDLPQTIAISQAKLIFSNRFLQLKDVVMKIGNNDLRADGRVENYMAYALKSDNLIGDFTLKSKYFNLNDFMTNDANDADNASSGVIEVPNNLNLSLNANFDELKLEKMNFKNSTAQLRVKDGTLDIESMKTDAFDGNLSLSGSYNTINPQQPFVGLDVDLKSISFAKILEELEFLDKFVPIFDKLEGRFNTKLKFNTTLDSSMSPLLNTIYSLGDFKAQTLLLNEQVGALNALMSSLELDKLSNIQINDLGINFEIKDGSLHTKPFNLNFKDYKINLGGTTGLDQSIHYNGVFTFPNHMDFKRFQQIGFNIGGTFQKPSISLDLKTKFDDIIQENIDKSKQKIDTLTNQLLDKGDAELAKIIAEAEKRANEIVQKAQHQSDKLLQEAQIRADSIVAKANNPLSKSLAQKTADELIKQAKNQADKLNEKAKFEADKIVEEAKTKRLKK